MEVIAPASSAYPDYRTFLDAQMAPYKKGLLKDFTGLMRKTLPHCMQNRLSDFHTQLEVILSDKLFLELFSPSFDRLIADQRTTAWVCANDAIARIALRYLRMKHVAVPERIALMGFDDTTDAYSEDLTSYNFNIPAAASLLVSYILKPSVYRHTRPYEALPIEGIIVERASTRK